MKALSAALIAASSFVSFSGCSGPEFRYVPVEHQTARGDARTGEAVYSVPAQAPTGSVRVLSMGVVDIRSKTSGEKFPAVHLRMTISNQSDKLSWAFNAADQLVAFPDQSQVHPFLANSDSTSLPNFEIAPQSLRVVDLYFRLPSSEKSAQDLPVFDFHWQVRTGKEFVNETTAFDRKRVHEYAHDGYVGPYYGFGWGPMWWGETIIVPGPFHYGPIFPPNRPVIVPHGRG